MPGSDRASLLTYLSLDVYIPRSQIHFIRLLSREAHISVKKLAMGLGIKRYLWQEHLLQERYVTAGGNSCDC